MVTITIAALLVFDVPFRGNVLVLAGCTMVFLVTSLGLGLFVSNISQTQQRAEMATFFIMQPVFMLSGFAVPLRNMPDSIAYFTYLNPLRYYMEIVRGAFLKGSGFDVLWPQVASLAVFGVIIMTLSVARFQKRLDHRTGRQKRDNSGQTLLTAIFMALLPRKARSQASDPFRLHAVRLAPDERVASGGIAPKTTRHPTVLTFLRYGS